MEQRVADYIFATIAKLGVKDVFLLPGGGAMHLVDALGQNKDLNFVACHHEQAAAIAAEAYSRVNETLGVALVTTGPGATNTLTAVAGAWIESVPLLIISGQVKRADMKASTGVRQMGPQEVDIVSMVKPITKYAATIENPEEIKHHLDTAISLATSGRKGPVWLDVPLDIQASMVNLELSESDDNDSGSDDAGIDEIQIESVLSLIKQARRPLILAGHGVRLSGAAQQFSELYNALQIPVVTTWNSLDLIPYDHELCVGRPGSVALRAPNFAVQNCDLLISIGARLDNVVTAHNPQGFAKHANKVVVDIDQNELNKHTMHIDEKVCANAADFIAALLASSPESAADYSQWHQQCQTWKQKYPVCDGQDFPESGEISIYHFMEKLSEHTQQGELVITGSSGLSVEAFYMSFINKPEQRVFLTSGLGSMGYGLPAAIGGCIAAGGKPVVSVEGDGSLQLNLQELSTLKALNLPIRMFVMNNSGYASIRNTQRNYFDGRYVATGESSGLHMPDIVAVAKAVGLDTLSIDDASQLDDKIQQALNHSGPLICDVRLISDEALWPKVAAIPQADGSMISMPLEDMNPLLTLEKLEEEMILELNLASKQARG